VGLINTPLFFFCFVLIRFSRVSLSHTSDCDPRTMTRSLFSSVSDFDRAIFLGDEPSLLVLLDDDNLKKEEYLDPFCLLLSSSVVVLLPVAFAASSIPVIVSICQHGAGPKGDLGLLNAEALSMMKEESHGQSMGV
jgi:hypothetical protein